MPSLNNAQDASQHTQLIASAFDPLINTISHKPSAKLKTLTPLENKGVASRWRHPSPPSWHP